MFRRLWSGLPKDPEWPSDLTGLGYFVNDKDEIRNIDDPKSYFKYFITKNERWNDRQRFAMNEAVQKLVHRRLEAEGLVKVLLPLGTTDATERHLPIFVSADLATKSRVVIIFGQAIQDLGILAHRVIGGPGGINKGCMVSIVQILKKQASSPTDPAAPGIILANMGQTWWWPDGKRALCPLDRHGAPMPSAVHWGVMPLPGVNTIPGNSSPPQHVKYMLDKVVPTLVNPEARLDILDLSDDVVRYLDTIWDRLGPRMSSLALLNGFTNKDDLKNDAFKTFLKDRARAWVTRDEELGTPISGPEGNPMLTGFSHHGCPSYSAGPGLFTETALIEAKTSVLTWMHEVATTPNYKNPYVDITAADIMPDTGTWATEEENQPTVEVAEAAVEDTGKTPDLKKPESHEPPAVKIAALNLADESVRVAEKQKVEETIDSKSSAQDVVASKKIGGVISPNKPEDSQDKEPDESDGTNTSGKTEVPGGHAEPLDEQHARAMVMQFLARSEEAAVRLLQQGVKEDDDEL